MYNNELMKMRNKILKINYVATDDNHTLILDGINNAPPSEGPPNSVNTKKNKNLNV